MPSVSAQGDVSDELTRKEQGLRALLREFESVIVAFSGGVDSAYLAFVAHDELRERAVAVTGDSASYPTFQRALADRLTSQFGIQHAIIFTEEFADSNYTTNPPNRCYFCKTELYGKLHQFAQAGNFHVICDGTNADDVGDYRPGRQAAREKGVRSPLLEVGLRKAEIRELSRLAGLPTWDEPASACLSSRIPYGQMVTLEKLSMIDRAENELKRLGFKQVRVRHHDEVARVEVGESEMQQALNLDTAKEIATRLRAIGFKYVALDLQGYRTGSLNESLR